MRITVILLKRLSKTGNLKPLLNVLPFLNKRRVLESSQITKLFKPNRSILILCPNRVGCVFIRKTRLMHVPINSWDTMTIIIHRRMSRNILLPSMEDPSVFYGEEGVSWGSIHTHKSVDGHSPDQTERHKSRYTPLIPWFPTSNPNPYPTLSFLVLCF